MTIIEFILFLDCKTVVFGRFRKTKSAVRAILVCEAFLATLPILPRRYYTSARPFVACEYQIRLDLSMEYRPLPAFAKKNTTVLQSILLQTFLAWFDSQL